MNMFPRRALVVAVLFLLVAVARAQSTASLSGTVMDSSGAVVPGAQIELTNEASKAQWHSKSNGQGFFNFVAIMPATYSLTVSRQDFETWTVTGIVAHPGDNLTVPKISLQVGRAEISLTVTAETAGVALDAPEHSTLISSEDIKRLSTQGRDVSELLNILPGFVVSNGQDMQNEGPGGIYGLQTMGFGSGNLGSVGANGAAPQQGLVNINSDGANLIDPGDMGGQVSNVNMDQVQEVKVETANFGADQAKGPIVINAVGKSGGSTFHGGLYTYFRNAALNSNDWLGKSFGQARPAFRYFYPGGTLGGPVLIPGTNFNKKKSLIFFAGFEYYGQNAPQFLAESFIPTANMLGLGTTNPGVADLSPTSIVNALGSGVNQADLAANCSADYNVSALYNNIGGMCYSPNGSTDQTGAIVSGGQLQHIDPAMLAIAALWPAANRTPQPVFINGTEELASDGLNYVKNINATHNGFQLHTRVDQGITDTLKLYGTFNWERINDEAPLNNIYYNPNSTVPYPTPEYSHGHAYYLTLGLVKSIGSSLTNELVGSGVYYDEPKQFANPAAAQTTGTAWGKAGYSGGVNHLQETQFPLVLSYEDTGLPSLPFGYVPASSEYLKKFDWNVTDNVTKIYKTHTFKAGGYVEDTGNSNLSVGSNVNGKMPFMRWDGCYLNETTPTTSGLPNNGNEAGLGNIIGNFLMGCPLSYSQDNSNPVQDVRYRSFEGFLTDSWKVNSRLTLTLGMRFSHLEPWSDAHGIGMAVWNPSAIAQHVLYPDTTANTTWPGITWHGKNSQIPNAGVPTTTLFYSPRLGLAYDLYGDGKTTFRGGWGMYYSHDSVGIAGSALASASGLQTYNTPGNVSCSMGQLFTPGPNATYTSGQIVPCGHYSSNPSSITPFLLSAMDPKDNHMPLTYNYNFTLDQQGPWKTAIEIAYVGNQSANLSTLGNLQNQNVIPLGSMFLPDPCSGCAGSGIAYSPTNIPVTSDYRPYPNYTQVNVANHIVWANYNALQAAWNRQSGGFVYGVNYTWSKAMGVRGNYDTGSIADPIDPQHDYGVLGFDRPEVFNVTYSYAEGKKYKGNRVLGQALNGWEVSGILQVQSGMDLAVANAGTNFGLGGSSSGINYTAGGSTHSIPVAGAEWLGSSDYSLQPVVTCDPRSHLNKNQFVNGSCFGLPALGSQGWWNLPDVHGPAYFKWDMSVFKNFALTEKQKMQFRVSGFNFLNHPLTSFNNNDLGSLNLAAGDPCPTPANCPVYTTAAQALQNAGISNASNFGFTPYKNGVRILELALKYDF